jgi:hypothetical protein
MGTKTTVKPHEGEFLEVMRPVVRWVCHAHHGVGTHKSCPFRRYFLYTQEKTQNKILRAHPYLKWTNRLTKMGDRASVGESVGKSVGHPDQELLAYSINFAETSNSLDRLRTF